MTRTLHIEARQHDIAGIDLGEGPPRAAMVFGAVVVVLWCGGLLLLFGLPSKALMPVYVVPPAVLAIYGFQEDENNPRRRKITSWVLSVRNVLTGQNPIVALGRHHRPKDRASVLRRVAVRFSGGDIAALVKPWKVEQGTTTQLPAERVSRADPIKFAPKVHTYGIPDVLAYDQAQRAKHDAKAKRAARHRTQPGNKKSTA